MTGIEALTVAAGVSALWWGLLRQRGWGRRVAALLVVAAWAVAADVWLWGALAWVTLVGWGWRRWLPHTGSPRGQAGRLREGMRQLLLLSWTLVAAQYLLYVWQLGRGETPLLARPDIVDAFLPIAGGLGLRAWGALGLTDPHHPAATVSLLVISLSALLLGRSFCGWACPLGLIGEWLHRLRSRWLPGEWTPPRWLDMLLRAQKWLVLGFLLFIILLAVPTAALPGYLASSYHQAADMKMGAFFFTLTPLAAGCLGWVLLLTVTFRQGFCRYLCPYGAWLGLLAVVTPLRIRRDKSRCLRSQGHDCDKCSRACPARIEVHQIIAVRSLECSDCRRCMAACPSRANALHLGSARRRLGAPLQLALLCLFLFLLPLLADGLLDLWVSQTPLAVRRHLLALLPYLSH
ncbi:4Fe-4S binding protein [Aeromonas simiae]|uniref:4Fe-4S binding protein n=1 Tax=Aeromonas simiae TaxID=218936 RepID=UPI00266C3EDA|nr:4Fe-4S binding protein [Aeromonas simiae]MDO2949952.1 4Fe-4S binding protein [Aeromonas simiae]MDO2953698.1 4Fe-4S binding protein [Aeromonas simiae]MDO2957309.1 4Fe-4S binding protein [Aeromonas simiae]